MIESSRRFYAVLMGSTQSNAEHTAEEPTDTPTDTNLSTKNGVAAWKGPAEEPGVDCPANGDCANVTAWEQNTRPRVCRS